MAWPSHPAAKYPSPASSVPDLLHFGVDPDPRIHASDQGIRIRDPDPAIFVTDLQEANKKQFFMKFFCLLSTYFLKIHLHHFSKIKSPK